MYRSEQSEKGRAMKCFMWSCALSGLFSVGPTAAEVSSTKAIVVGNADNQIALQSDASAPQVLRLTRIGGETWQGSGAEILIGSATVEGVEVPLRWRFDAKSSRMQENSVSLVYEAHHPDLRLRWEWRAPAQHGPIEHTIRIENRSGHEVWIPLQDSFRFGWKIDADQPLEQLWIEKGAGEAPPVGTHLVPIGDGYNWHGASSTFAHPRTGEAREIIPYFLVRNAGAAIGGWYVGVEFSGRIALNLKRRGDALEGVVGLNPEPGPFRTRLAPGETFATPTVFVGASDGDVDATGNTLRRWVREVLNDPATVRNPAYPFVTNNSWGSAMAITEAQALRMIHDAHTLGFEMFHLDAGWFRAVGDWYPDPKKFPHGLAAVSDYAHKLGLKFGLWVDWAQAGTSQENGALNVADLRVRDWLTTDPPPGWKTAEFKGITIDLGVPAAKAWAAREVDRIVRDYHVDMLEHDGYVIAQGCDRSTHPHAPIDPARASRYSDDDFLWMDSSNSTDVSFHATRAYYDIHLGLKRKHPGLMLEICNDGGRMVDFGSAAHGDYFSIVDAYDPLSNRQAFFDASHVLPPAMLETYVKEWPTPRIENFRYMLRSGMMGWLTVMIDTSGWSREQHAVAAEELAFYKSMLRPLIRSADLYHVGPRADGSGWDGLEYFDAQRDTGVLYAFHGSDAAPGVFNFPLRGLRADSSYRLHFKDGSSPDREAVGRELLRSGVAVSLPLANSSELIVIEKL
jgi:Melibiase